MKSLVKLWCTLALACALGLGCMRTNSRAANPLQLNKTTAGQSSDMVAEDAPAAMDTTPVVSTGARVETKPKLSSSQLQAAINEPVGKVVKTEAEWKKILTPVQFNILRQAGTEPAFSGEYKSQGPGIYRCSACGLALFDAATKFDSGTGWPSFYQPLSKSHVIEKVDPDGERKEILCARCGGHLGHVFDDGPKPTGLRYCMNSPALKYEPAKVPTAVKALPAQTTMEKATFAAGCFWSMEAIFKQLKGVSKAEPGYSGGTSKNPTYEQVETGNTGYAETLDITYDPKSVSFADLLQVLLTIRNPTTLNKQGPDEGPQYRSIIFYRTPEQKAATEAMIQKVNASHLWRTPIVTEVRPFNHFYPAEAYHRDYYNLHPMQGYCANVIAPELKEFREKFKTKLKS